jgi:putative hydrolase of the HAD superfamily
VVLWDADGVLQRMPDRNPLFPTLGAEASADLAAAIFDPLPELLTGRLDMAQHLDRVLAERGLAARRDEVLGLWREEHAPVPEARRLLTAVRRSGVRCVLATNQDTLMAEGMRDRYTDLVDAAYFSCDVGSAKPDAAYFARVATAEGVDRTELLLIDDSSTNVESARAIGLSAEQWHADDGIEALRDLLARHGLAG